MSDPEQRPSRKLEDKQRRRLADERKKEALKKAHRKRNLVTTAVALLVAAGVVALVISDRNRITQQIQNYGVSEDEASCGEVEEHEPHGADHIGVGEAHEPYDTNPPTSGPHYNEAGLGPVQTGFYEDAAEAPPEGVLHNLEHSQIVIYYNPDAPDEVIEDIELAVKDEPLATVATPWTQFDEEGTNLVLAAWGAAQACEQVSQDVVNEFRRAFQGQGPEKAVAPYTG